MTDTLKKLPWYEKRGLVIFLLVVFWPVGLFGMWRSTTFGQKAKILVSVVAGVLTLAALGGIEPTAGDEDQLETASTPEVKSQEKLLEEKVREALSGGFFESGISDEEVLSFEIHSVGESRILRFHFDTGEWLGLMRRTELRSKLVHLLVPIHRVAQESPELSEVHVKVFSPAATRHDEFGNELPESNVLLFELHIPCDDFLKFEDNRITDGPVYIADRFVTKLNPRFKKDFEWEAAVAEERRLWFK